MKTKYTLFLLFLTTLAFAQNDRPKRDSFILKLAVNEKNYYRMDVPRTDYFVKDRILQIYATEKLNIEVTLQSDTIATMKVVKKIKFPERTIQIDFMQKEGLMMLNVKNPFDKKLLYTANMFLVGHDKWIPTSTIPIRPHLQSFESWPDPIISLCLDDWRFVE